MILRYLKLIILNYFRLLLGFAIIGKLIYPATFKSYTLSFFKFWGVENFFNELGMTSDFLVFSAYLFVQLAEFLLIYVSFKNLKLFKYGLAGLLGLFLLVTVIALAFGIEGDCGCFGNILVFENTADKAAFNFANLLLGLLLLEKNCHKGTKTDE